MKNFGPGLVCTEMVSSKAIQYNDEKTKKLMNIKGENIYEDADTFLEKIGIGDKIVLPVYSK